MDQISKSLNAATPITELTFPNDEQQALIVTDHHKQLEQNLQADYAFARDNLRKIIISAMEVIPNAMALTKEAENARLYESTGSFIKTIAEINKDLLDITERNLKPVNKQTITADNTTINNNAIFMGTTDELFNHIISATKHLEHK